MELAKRLKLRQDELGVSTRDIGAEVGVSHSTISRVMRGEGDFSRESERLLRQWLGDDVSDVLPQDMIDEAHELGRVIARSFASELKAMIDEIIAARGK